jgi:signal transduction histidine kinase/ligand-binding sensor domain-containing protein
LLPDRILQFSSEPAHAHRVEVLRQSQETGLGKFIAIAPSRDGGLWVTGSRGLAKIQGPIRALTAQNDWRDFVTPEDWHARNFHALHEGSQGDVTVLAESATNTNQVLIAVFDGRAWTEVRAVSEPLQHAWRGVGKRFWAITWNSLLEYGDGSAAPTENHEIPVRQFFDVAVEPSGTFWLATSDGLFRHTPLCWQAPVSSAQNDGAVQCLSPDAQAGIWFITGNSLHWQDQEYHRNYPFPASLAASLQAATAIYPLKNRTLAIEAGQQVFKFDVTSGAFAKLADTGDEDHMKPVGFNGEGILAIQTRAKTSSNSQVLPLHAYDGVQLRAFPLPPMESSLGAISSLFAAQNGDLWISGQSGTACLHEKKWRAFSGNDESAPQTANAFIELTDGKIWCATGDRVWEFDGKNWLALRRGFNGINSLVQTRDGSVWVASNNGLFRFFQGTWIENAPDEGLPSLNIRGLCEDKSDHLWAATPQGLRVFQPKADPDPPRTVIHPLADPEAKVPEGGTLKLSYSGQDKWKFTSHLRLLYSYHLDGRDWSPFLETDNISFSDLSAGKHYFQVRAMDRNCNVDPKPASLEFVVVLPWYREARLVFISSAGAAVALFFAALAFNRHRRLLRSYAEVEKKVAQRTLELERANRELFHSQKMNALGTLAAGIAHDFNNILSIVKGSAQIIEENVHDSQKVAIRVERIKTVVEQGAGIVKAMLGFSRESDQQPGPCDLNDAVRDTIKLLGDRFLREVQISFEPEADLPAVLCSKDLIQQILLNFIFNAAESMSEAKRIILTTHRCERIPDNVILAPTKANAYASVSVQDTGSGIAPENLSRIFEPFFTTKAMSVRRGTGLGLSMVYEFARKMNAGLAVSSIVGRGSTFTLILPVPAPVESMSITETSATKERTSKVELPL